MKYHQFWAMNTAFMLASEAPEPEQSFAMTQTFIEKCEQHFTRFKATSELSALNRSAGDWFSVSPEMLELLILAMECHRATNGIFDPSILPDLQSAGYTQSFDQLREHGADSNPSHGKRSARIPFSAIEIDSLQGRVRLPLGMQIDLGGIAKGWVAERGAALLAENASACGVNAGGDMFLIGHPQGQDHWEVALEDPREPSKDLMTLLVDHGAVATSSIAKRIWQQGDVKRHHLIDPRTGDPAETPWLSVTVFASTAVYAETFAKSVLIAGPEQAGALLNDHPEISFLAVDAQGQLWKSPTEKETLNEYA